MNGYINNLTTNWKQILLQYSNDLDIISNKLSNERTIYEPHLHIFPPKELIFAAFNQFDFQKLKVVFVGQDCYHGKGQANGLCFSVPNGCKIPPSLKNIFKELKSDLNIERSNTDFSDLAKQGVLFLNSSLTVREKCPTSHIDWWVPFTNNILKYISDNQTNVVFVLWGNYAKSKKQFMVQNRCIYTIYNNCTHLNCNFIQTLK